MVTSWPICEPILMKTPSLIDVLQDNTTFGEIITPFSIFRCLPKTTDEWMNERILKFLYFLDALKSHFTLLHKLGTGKI